MEKNLCMRPEFFSFSIVKSHLWVSRTRVAVWSGAKASIVRDHKVTLPVRLTLAHSVSCVRSFVIARVIVRVTRASTRDLACCARARSCVLRARAIVRDTRTSARSRVPRSPPLRAVGSGVVLEVVDSGIVLENSNP